MGRLLRIALLFYVPLAIGLTEARAQGATQAVPRAANRAVYLDKEGVVRWRDDKREVTLFGANYVVTTASDYRAAGYLGADRKKMIEEDMAQFARMGWDGIRLTFWGDWESADSAGNLIAKDHLDLLDYLVARARERGIYMLFSPIQLYNANWPDALQDTTSPGFGRRYDRSRMGTDPAAIAAQVNYLRQILNHVNPYTGVALKNEPGILFVELVNEPVHHPEDLAGSVRYINTLTDAVRSTGCSKLIFYNVSQDFRITEAILRSRVQGVTFGWYPSGLNSGHELKGNYLRGVDAFADMLRPDMARMPRIVYEFDSPDLLTGTMYPAMARTFRTVGTQFAAMFSYDMLATASRNLGWQTHYLNLVYTPRKTMSAIIAAEAMRRLPRMRSYGGYPANTRFGDFRISAAEDLGELVARDAFLYTGSTGSVPPDPAALRQIAGVGTSSTVSYEGTGIYFLDKVRPGLWRLEVYPDVVPVRDPFEPMSPDKIVTRTISSRRPMQVTLPDLGGSFTVQPVTAGNSADEGARDGRFSVRPGVYVLSTSGRVDPAALPSHTGHVGFAEYHAPPPDVLPVMVESLTGPALLAGMDGEIRVRVVDTTRADSVRLFIRQTAGDFYRALPMRPAGSYEYSATLPVQSAREGAYEFVVSRFEGGSVQTFPGGLDRTPWHWDYHGSESWKVNVVGRGTPLELFSPERDATRLTFTRIGDAGRRGLFRVALSAVSGRQVFHLELPTDAGGKALPDYTASLVVLDRVRARRESILGGESLGIRLRGLGPRQQLHLTLMEDDGTSWSTAVPVDSVWTEVSVPLSALKAGRGALLPQGFPGEWNYWVGPAEGRGGAADRLRLDHLERIQLSLRREDGVAVTPGSYGVEVEWVRLTF